MLIIHMARPKFSIQGFLVVLAVLVGWSLVFATKFYLPQSVTPLYWQPVAFFPVSPSLLIDDTSWIFAIALMTLALSSVVTSIAKLGQSRKPDNKKIEVIETQDQPEINSSMNEPGQVDASNSTLNWQSWAGILIQTGIGLVAVTAGNMLTLLLAWAALDFHELFLLLGQELKSKSRERIILTFSIRMAGIGLVLMGAIIPWSQDNSLSFISIDRSVTIYLILASILRLGVFPLQQHNLQYLTQQRELSTTLRLVTAASSLILVVRVANIGVIGAITPYILGFTALTGLFAGIQWLISSDEVKGQLYWVLGTAALAIASGVLNLHSASIAWSMACLLSGGLLFSMSLRHKNLAPVAFLGIYALSTLPFSPTWIGSDLFIYSDSLLNILAPPIFYIISIAFLLTLTLFLAGFIRHILRGILPSEEQTGYHIERWVWFLFPIGIIFVLLTHYLIGIMLFPKLEDVPLIGWIIGLVVFIISCLFWYLYTRYFQGVSPGNQPSDTSIVKKYPSLGWLNRIFWKLFNETSKMIALISLILEGDGGILWAFVLFALIFVFLQR
jgi:hypothetical protein